MSLQRKWEEGRGSKGQRRGRSASSRRFAVTSEFTTETTGNIAQHRLVGWAQRWGVVSSEVRIFNGDGEGSWTGISYRGKSEEREYVDVPRNVIDGKRSVDREVDTHGEDGGTGGRNLEN